MVSDPRGRWAVICIYRGISVVEGWRYREKKESFGFEGEGAVLCVHAPINYGEAMMGIYVGE